MDVEMATELPRTAAILTEDAVDPLQDIKRPQSNITQVANRSSDDIEASHSGAIISSSPILYTPHPSAYML